MKNKLPKAVLLCIVGGMSAAFSTPLFKKSNSQTALAVQAAPHQTNFDPYTYSGTYYDSIGSNLTEGMDGTLRTTLTTKIKPVTVPEYSPGLAVHLQGADEDPTNSANMIYFYTRDSVKKNAASSWNREHVWPKSTGNWNESNAGADLLHLRPTYPTPNNVRGNKKYGAASTQVTYNGMVYGKSDTYFEPLDCVKGDAARICMYVWVAWKNFYGGSMSPLTNVFSSYDTLMMWHIQDRPDVLEGNRNDYAESSMQKNRNPFVDHPEYAWKIFGNQLSSSVLAAAKEAYPDEGGEYPADLSAKDWSTDFINQTGAVCKNDGSTDYEALSAVWEDVSESFKTMDAVNKGYVINPTTGPDSFTKYYADLAKKRYDFIVKKYEDLEKFMGEPANSFAFKQNYDYSYIYSLIVLTSIITILISTRLIYNVKRRNK